jgi:hypothetical protein
MIEYSLDQINVIKANVDSPVLTGTPTAPTATVGTNTTQLATTAFVQSAKQTNLTLMTSVATTSGTSIDFTGLPSWVKRVTIMLNGVSTNGTSHVQIQLGNGSVVNSGYLSNAGSIGTAGNSSSSSGLVTSGVVIDGFASQATFLRTGHVTFHNITGNTWLGSGVTSDVSASISVQMCGGSVSLTSALDRIRFTTVNGTDIFDAGSINIMYEG